MFHRGGLVTYKLEQVGSYNDVVCVRDVLGLNLCRDTGFPDWGPSWYSSVPQEPG
jgi:hypothetical protein